MSVSTVEQQERKHFYLKHCNENIIISTGISITRFSKMACVLRCTKTFCKLACVPYIYYVYLSLDWSYVARGYHRRQGEPRNTEQCHKQLASLDPDGVWLENS